MLRRILSVAAVAAVVLLATVQTVAQAQTRVTPALDGLRQAVPSTATTEDAVFGVFQTQLGSDAARIRAVQADLGVRSTGALTGDTLTRLHAYAATIAQANADTAEAARRAAAQLPPPGEGGDADDEDGESGEDDEESGLKLVAAAREYAAAHCNPGSQVVALSSHRFTCTDPEFKIVEGACALDAAGRMHCDSKVVPPSGREEPLPPLRQLPRAVATAKNAGWCDGSTFCKVAVVTGSVAAVGAAGLYVGHVVESGSWSPITVQR